MEYVNHPQHYLRPGRKECIEEIHDLYGDEILAIFCYTNAYKYLYRAGEKANNSKEQDLNKAMWYINYAKTHVPRTAFTGAIRMLRYNVEAQMEAMYDKD